MYTYRNPSTRPDTAKFANQPWRPREGYFWRKCIPVGKYDDSGYLHPGGAAPMFRQQGLHVSIVLRPPDLFGVSML